MSKEVELTYLVQLNQDRTEKRYNTHIVEVLIYNTLDYLICLQVVLFLEVLLCFDLSDIKVLTLT